MPKLPQPIKRFGQHFLIDEQIIAKMLVVIDAKSTDHLIEIGAGNGVLTFPLARSNCHLTAVEIDKRLHHQLAQSPYPNLKVICADALDYDFDKLLKHQSRIVGNLPYNIAVPLIEKLLDSPHIKDMHFLVQQEIAQRLFAEVGQSHYGRLSLLRSSQAQGEILFEVPSRAFYPRPQVVSSFIRLIPTHKQDSAFKEIIRLAFSRPHRRLRNNLPSAYEPLLKELQLAERRPINLSLEDFVLLTNRIKETFNMSYER